MSKYNWENNSFEGRGMRRVFRILLRDLKGAKTSQERCEIARAMGYVATCKSTLSKVDWEQLDKRLATLEEVARISKKGSIER